MADPVKKRAPRGGAPRSGGGRSGGPRSAARLGAVQVLYQIDLTGAVAKVAVAEYVQHYFGKEIDGDEYVPADEPLFREIVAGTLEKQAEFDPLISKLLTADWPLERLEMILRAILRAAAFELSVRIDTPARVVITEYVDIAHAFFAGKEPGLINGVLDKLARQCRPAEWSGEGR